MKKFSVIACIFVLLCAASCGAQQEPITSQAIETYETTTETTETTTIELTTTAKLEPLVDLSKYDRSKVGAYSAKKNTFSKTNAQNVEVAFDYPQLANMKDKAKQQKINKMIYEAILTVNSFDEEGYLDILDYFSMDYHIELLTSDLISISFVEDFAYVDGASNETAKGLTFDLNTMQKLDLTDFVDIDENFANNLIASERVFDSRMTLKKDLDWNEMVLRSFRGYWTAQEILHLFEDSREFYVTPTTLCVMFPIDYNLGGYVWVEVPLEG